MSIEFVPRTQNHEIKPLHTIDSHKYNEFQSSVRDDLIELYSIVNELYDKVSYTDEVMFYGFNLHEAKLHELEMKVLYPESDTVKYVFVENAWVDGSIENPCQIDRIAKVIKPQYLFSPRPRTFFQATSGEVFIPRNVPINITPIADNITIIDKNITGILTPHINDIFFRKYIFSLDNPTEKVEIIIDISVPIEFSTSNTVNMIRIQPLFQGVMNLEKIEYDSSSNWIEIPNVKREKIKNEEIYIKPIRTNRMRFTFTQEAHLTSENKKIFPVGFKHIGLYYVEFSPKSSVYFDITLPNGIKRINNIVPISDSEVTGYSLEMYAKTNDTLIYLKNSLPFVYEGDILTVKLTLDNTKSIQVIKGLKVELEMI